MGIIETRFAVAQKTAQTAFALAIVLACAMNADAQPQAPAQGVLSNELVVGTHVDLSGPLAPWGTAVKNGLTLAIEEANRAGGVNGRNVRLIAKDDSYDPEKAAAAVRQLASEDRVFAILSPLGTQTVTASLHEALSRGVLYLFPLTASPEAHSPLAPLKFALTPTHEMEVQEGLRRILNARGPLKVGVLAPNDAFGRAVSQGTVNELGRRGLAIGALLPFQRGSATFESIAATLQRERVDVVVLGIEPEETLALLRVARAMRWRPLFLCASACYAPEFATIGAANAEGLMAVSQVAIPYADDPKLRSWVRRYETRFSAVPTVQAVTAYRNARFFLAILRQAGRSPTQASVANILETRGSWTDPEIGGLPIEFSPTDHLGGHSGLLAQVRGGRWVLLADNLVSTMP